MVRPVARYVLGYYFRNIDITGLENIPSDKPVILAANHPTAFIEPCLLACFQERPLHFLARGDLFVNRLATAVLRALNILPVYRLKDGGYKKLTRNYATFEDCYRVLHRRQALMILAEGRCIHEKRLRPLRKGTARIALGALVDMNFPEEVYIIPVGVNFVAAERFRTSVAIHCGQPIYTSNYLDAYRDNEARAIQSLTDELRRRLETMVVQFPDPAFDADYEAALEVTRHTIAPRLTGLTHSGAPLEIAHQTARRVDPLDRSIPDFVERLRREHVTVEQLVAARWGVDFPVLSLPALLVVIPQLPLWLISELVARIGTNTIEFYSPVRFAAMAVGTLLYLPLLFVLSWPGKLYLLVSVVGTNWALRQLERLKLWWGARRAKTLGPAMYQELIQLQQELVQ